MTEEQFHNNISSWIGKDISTWNHITLLAYFCHKYEQVNGIKFRLVRARKGPTMGKEAADFAKLFRTLAPEYYSQLDSDGKKVIRKEVNLKIKNYINWMFDYKFRSGHNSVNGTRLFLLPSMIVEFERMYSKFLNKKKSQDKLSTLLEWCSKEVNQIFDLHELNSLNHLKIIKNYAAENNLDFNSPEVRVVKKAKNLGLL